MLVDLLNDCVRLNEIALTIVVEPMPVLELRYMGVPGRIIFAESDAPAIFAQIIEISFEYTDMVPVGIADLANFRDVDVEMCDVFGIRRKS